MNFDEMILEAAKSIAAATSALIKAASGAQRELIASGKVSRTLLTSSDDGQWSEGLISAARMVAAATHSLVESANALVQGLSSEEKLISSAKQVASSTAQLLVACKVKADPDSENTKRLQAAGNAVKRATDNLVRAAQQAIQQEEERSLVLNRRIVGGIAQEINARSEVLRIEKELEEARGRLTAIRQAKYKNRSDISENDSEIVEIDFNSSYPDQTQDFSLNAQFIKNDKESLISPEKVNSTQSSLEKQKKDKEYICSYNEMSNDSASNNYRSDDTRSRTFDIEPTLYSSFSRKSEVIDMPNTITTFSGENSGYFNPAYQSPFTPKITKCNFFKESQGSDKYGFISNKSKFPNDSINNRDTNTNNIQTCEKEISEKNSSAISGFKSIDDTKRKDKSMNDNFTVFDGSDNEMLYKQITKESILQEVTEKRVISTIVLNPESNE